MTDEHGPANHPSRLHRAEPNAIPGRELETSRHLDFETAASVAMEIGADPLTAEALRAYAKTLRAAAVSHRYKGTSWKSHRAWLREQASRAEQLSKATDALRQYAASPGGSIRAAILADRERTQPTTERNT